MTLKFFCPNGHPLTATEDLAGKSGKCPKCHAQFVVPAASAGGETAAAAAATPAAATVPANASAAAAPVAVSGAAAQLAMGDVMIFQCPQGHKLSGSKSLQGKPGQCPYCGAKFRIPGGDDPQKSGSRLRFRVADDDIPVGEILEPHEEAAPEPSAAPASPVAPSREPPAPAPETPAREAPLPSLPAEAHPWAHLCVRVWRQGKGSLEIAYGDGQTLQAECFSVALSQGEFGVFAQRNAGGDFTVTAIPWSAVRRIVFRHVAQLPLE